MAILSKWRGKYWRILENPKESEGFSENPFFERKTSKTDGGFSRIFADNPQESTRIPPIFSIYIRNIYFFIMFLVTLEADCDGQEEGANEEPKLVPFLRESRHIHEQFPFPDPRFGRISFAQHSMIFKYIQ